MIVSQKSSHQPQSHTHTLSSASVLLSSLLVIFNIPHNHAFCLHGLLPIRIVDNRRTLFSSSTTVFVELSSVHMF